MKVELLYCTTAGVIPVNSLLNKPLLANWSVTIFLYYFLYFGICSRDYVTKPENMPSNNVSRSRSCHVVAMAVPGRGHINPMMNFCKLLASRRDDVLITFVVTEEWLGLIGSDSKPDNIRFGTIPNVTPSERVRATNLLGFLEAVMTKMEDPFEQLLKRLETPVTTILADTFLFWAVSVGNRMSIPVASFFPMSASVFSMFHHFDLLVQNGHHPIDISGG